MCSVPYGWISESMRAVSSRAVAVARRCRKPVTASVGKQLTLTAIAVMMAVTVDPLRLEAAPLSNPQLQKVETAVGDAAQWEIDARAIPSIAVALMMRDGTTAAGAWGFADQARTGHATPETIYRAGSVTKLLTDIVVMRLVEQGKLDLDVPVQRYLPSFHPHNPFGGEITLRQLMAHRSGLVREPPRGNYFDMHPKGQADAVASLNDTTLVAPPGSLTKYSNAAIGVVGEVIVHVTGKPYEQLITQIVLEPLGMRGSGVRADAVVGTRAYAQMASIEGPRFAAPQFELGLTAAGALYSNVIDLGRLIHVVLNRGQLENGRILNASTFDAMWTPQYSIGGERRYGLGFSVADLDGHRMVGHGGEIYGYATQILILPDDDVGVIVFSTVDSGPTAKRIGDYALRSALAEMGGKPYPAYFRTRPIPLEEARRLAGRFVSGDDSVVLRVDGSVFVLDSPTKAGEVRRAGERLYVDDPQTFDDSLSISPGGQTLMLEGRSFQRTAVAPKAESPPVEFAQVIGEYGWDYNFIRVYQRDGKPYARMEWLDYAPLRRVAADEYAVASDSSLYMREALTFERGPGGAVDAVFLSGIRFPRRAR